MRTILKKYIQENINKRKKALDSVWMNVLGVISALELTDEFVLEFITDAKEDKIFKSLNFLNGGNWVDEIKNPKYKTFLQTLFETCPKGIGTPNATCGEGELMLILSSPKIKRPTKNDIQIENGVSFNLKNDTPRVFAEIEGKKLNKVMMEEIKKIGLNPVEKNGKKSVQLVNSNAVKNHWNPQFLNLKKEQVSNLLFTFLINLFPNQKINESEINNIIFNCLDGTQLVWEKWVEELIMFIFKYGNDKSENLISMKVNGDVKVIPPNSEDFNKMIRNKIIKFDSGYFRMFQATKVGIYIKFN
jgi:hypothetical protein